MSNDPLRGCPTCGTEVSSVDLGFRDYRTLGYNLPGRVAPMDFDAVLERNGRVLILEFKPRGVSIGQGQKFTLKTMRRMGCEVWVIQGDPTDDFITVGEMNSRGAFPLWESMTPETLGNRITDWWGE